MKYGYWCTCVSRDEKDPLKRQNTFPLKIAANDLNDLQWNMRYLWTLYRIQVVRYKPFSSIY